MTVCNKTHNTMKKVKLFKVLPLLSMALAVFFISSCKKDGNGGKAESEGSEKIVEVSEISYTPCHEQELKNDPDYPDSLSVYCNGGIIYVTHYNLELMCGFTDIRVVVVSFRNDTINLQERGVYIAETDCFCHTDNSFQINNLQKGRYVIHSRNLYKTITLE